LGYYDTDALHTQTQGGVTFTNTLDAVGRPLTQATGPTGGAGVFDGDDGLRRLRELAGVRDHGGRWGDLPCHLRECLDGLLAATMTGSGQVQVAVADPHGDVVAQITLPANGDASGLNEWTDADAYGNAVNGTPVGATATSSPGNPTGDPTARPGYGWLGTHQRPTQGTGMVQMGARLYNPATGTFTSTDPLYRGNTTPYAYPQDPINRYDLNGQWWHWLRRAYEATTGYIRRSFWRNAAGFSFGYGMRLTCTGALYVFVEELGSGVWAYRGCSAFGFVAGYAWKRWVWGR
jgi:RHS repeat-associated protein